MNKVYSIRELFALSISAESKAKALYEEFGKIFSHEPSAADLWKSMSEDEKLHEDKLQEIFQSFSEKEKSLTIENNLIEEAERSVGRISIPSMLNSIDTLDDAYETAYSIEHSEINALMQFILLNFVPPGKRQDIAMSIVTEHISRLENFSKTGCNAERRREIKALK